MNEDRGMNEFLRGKLEEDISEIPSCLGELQSAAARLAREAALRRRLRFFLWMPLLAAACLTIAFMWTNLELPGGAATGETVGQVIDLLANDDGFDKADLESLPIHEKLLVWQDIPYENAVCEVYSEN